MQRRPNQYRRRRGFTLIELLIVIAILLAIGGLVVVNLIPRGEQAKGDLQRVQLDLVGSAFDNFRLDLNRWPSEDEGLEVLWRQDSLEDENVPVELINVRVRAVGVTRKPDFPKESNAGPDAAGSVNCGRVWSAATRNRNIRPPLSSIPSVPAV